MGYTIFTDFAFIHMHVHCNHTGCNRYEVYSPESAGEGYADMKEDGWYFCTDTWDSWCHDHNPNPATFIEDIA